MTGYDADAIADGTVSEHLYVKVTAWIAQRASIFYVTSFWASELFRTIGFLVLIVQFFSLYFHHCKRYLKKRTVGFDPLPPAYAVYAHENDDNYGRPLRYKILCFEKKKIDVCCGICDDLIFVSCISGLSSNNSCFPLWDCVCPDFHLTTGRMCPPEFFAISTLLTRPWLFFHTNRIQIYIYIISFKLTPDSKKIHKKNSLFF